MLSQQLRLLISKAPQATAFWQATAVGCQRSLSASLASQSTPTDRSRLLLAKPSSNALTACRLATEVRKVPPSHASMFAIERVLAVAMLPLFPTALFVHNAFIDYALAASVALHIHWGLHIVVEDYARPFVVGETLSKLCANSVFLVSILMFIGLLHFNYADVGITKAFEMVWSL